MTPQEINNWIKEEQDTLKANKPDYEEIPSLKFAEKEKAIIKIDITKRFSTWEGLDSKGKGMIKKILPCFVKGQRMNWWLNVKNPIYAEILEACSEGKNVLTIMQIGSQDKTRYVIIDKEGSQ